ncbi:MAG: hypothetical protein K2K57_06000 [Oscillospiraceae bacterium]|nr:hypothetical protein [Oscillospiraceae bacterium]
MSTSNADIRTAAKNAGVYLYQIAAKIGVSEPTMTRKMRYEMTASKKANVLSVIEKLRLEKEDTPQGGMRRRK